MPKTPSEPRRVLELVALPGADPVEAFNRGQAAWADFLGLEKAVEAHPSHFQIRSRGGQFRGQHPAFVTPRARTGRFLPHLSRAEVQGGIAEAARYINQFFEPALLFNLQQWEAGHMSSGEWFRENSRQIQLHYEMAYAQGKRLAGNPELVLTAQDHAVINRLVKDELTYLSGFRDHLDAGAGKMPYPDRMRLYAQAAWEALWVGWVMGDLRKGRELTWEFGATKEHCHDCSRFVAMGWLPVREFVARILSKGYAPRSGQLECQGHACLCILRERLNGEVQPALAYP